MRPCQAAAGVSFRLSPRPLAASLTAMPPARFVTDASLEFIARRLLFLGYDVTVHRGARLEELFLAAAAGGCVVLTSSARHPRRWVSVPVVRLSATEPAAAVRLIAEHHEPASPPFCRCPACNQALQARSAFEAAGEIPARVVRSGGPLRWCPSCGQWYWLGTHTRHLREWLEAALGRPLEDTSAARADAAPDA